jgi:hypothetical protein
LFSQSFFAKPGRPLLRTLLSVKAQGGAAPTARAVSIFSLSCLSPFGLKKSLIFHPAATVTMGLNVTVSKAASTFPLWTIAVEPALPKVVLEYFCTQLQAAATKYEPTPSTPNAS